MWGTTENLNRQVRKATKHKVTFEKEERLLDYIFVVIKDYEKIIGKSIRFLILMNSKKKVECMLPIKILIDSGGFIFRLLPSFAAQKIAKDRSLFFQTFL